MIYPKLKNIPLFKALKERQLETLSSKSEIQNRKKHELIFYAGVPSENIYLLLDGLVKIETFSSNSEKMVIKAMIQPFSIFGESALLKSEGNNKTAIAFSETVSYACIPVKTINHLMKINSAFAFSIFEHIGHILYKMEQRLESCILKSPKERLIDFIKLQVEKKGELQRIEPILVRHNYTQYEMAGLLGVAPQTIHGILKKLANKKLIQFRRKEIVVTNWKGLMVA